MRPFRVWNSIRDVRVEWKVAGIRFGPVASIAFLVAIAVGVLVVRIAGVIPAGAVVGVAFLTTVMYSTLLTRLDPGGTISELTQLRLLRRTLRHRHSANFDIDGI